LATSSSVSFVYFIGYYFTLAVIPNAKKMVKKIKENISILNHPITTICGFVCFFYSLFLIGYPLLYEPKTQIDIYFPITIGMFGICLLVIPDDLKGALKKLIKNKSE
jgi:amino acid transporter